MVRGIPRLRAPPIGAPQAPGQAANHLWGNDLTGHPDRDPRLARPMLWQVHESRPPFDAGLEDSPETPTRRLVMSKKLTPKVATKKSIPTASKNVTKSSVTTPRGNT